LSSANGASGQELSVLTLFWIRVVQDTRPVSFGSTGRWPPPVHPGWLDGGKYTA
jgi:hypothetical protein